MWPRMRTTSCDITTTRNTPLTEKARALAGPLTRGTATADHRNAYRADFHSQPSASLARKPSRPRPRARGGRCSALAETVGLGLEPGDPLGHRGVRREEPRH